MVYAKEILCHTIASALENWTVKSTLLQDRIPIGVTYLAGTPGRHLTVPQVSFRKISSSYMHGIMNKLLNWIKGIHGRKQWVVINGF